MAFGLVLCLLIFLALPAFAAGAPCSAYGNPISQSICRLRNGDFAGFWRLSYSRPTANGQPAGGIPQTSAPAPQEQTAPAETESEFSDFAKEVLRLVNAERTREGLAPLSLDARLCAAAGQRAQEACAYFSHSRPDGSSCFTVFSQYGIRYRAAGENIAKGYASPAAVVQAWMDSAGHRANIMNASYHKMGLGYVPCGSSYAWGQLFMD